MHDLHFEDNLELYKDLVPKNVKPHLPIYKDLIYKVAEVQKKLSGNMYRVTDIDDLVKRVENGQFKVGRYAVIEEENGSYKLTRFTDFFETEFEEIRSLLERIIKDLPEGDYKDYIESLHTAYGNNNFLDPYKKWILLKPDAYDVELMLFPVEVEFDKLFNTINSFDASLSVLAKEFIDTSEEEYKNYLLGIVKNIPRFSELHYKVEEDFSRLNIRVDYSIYAAGVHSIVPYYSQNLPAERNFASEWGSKIIIYKSTIDKALHNGFYSLAETILVDNPLSRDQISEALIHKLYIHEIVEALMIFAGARRRLKSQQPFVREFNSDIFGINTYLLYLLKTEDNTSKAVASAYTYVLSAFNYYSRNHTPETRSSHYKQYIACTNYFLSTGSLKLTDKNMLQIDAKAMIKDINELSKISSTLLMEGTEEQAKEFFDKYSDEEVFKKVLKIS